MVIAAVMRVDAVAICDVNPRDAVAGDLLAIQFGLQNRTIGKYDGNHREFILANVHATLAKLVSELQVQLPVIAKNQPR